MNLVISTFKWYATLPCQSSLKSVNKPVVTCTLLVRKREVSTALSVLFFPLEEGMPPCWPLVWTSTADLQATPLLFSPHHFPGAGAWLHKAASLVSSSFGSLCCTPLGHPMVVFRKRSWQHWTGGRKVVVADFRSPSFDTQDVCCCGSFNVHLKAQGKGRSAHFRKSSSHCCDDVS